MASKMSIISLFIVLLATFCYSVPVEEITTVQPDQSVLTDATTATQEAKANMFLVTGEEVSNLLNIRKKRSTENEETSTQGQTEAVTRSSNPSEDPENEESSTQGQTEAVTRSSNPSEEPEKEESSTEGQSETATRSSNPSEDPENEESSTQGQSEAVTRSSNPSEEGEDGDFTTPKLNEPISSNSSTLNKIEDKRTLNGSPLIVHDNKTEHVRRIPSESSTTPNPPDNFNESEWGGSPVKEPTSNKGKRPQTITSETEYPKRALEDITTPETLLTTSSSNNIQHLTYSEIIVPGDVKFATLNGTGSSEHILNQLSRGEKHTIVH